MNFSAVVLLKTHSWMKIKLSCCQMQKMKEGSRHKGSTSQWTASVGKVRAIRGLTYRVVKVTLHTSAYLFAMRGGGVHYALVWTLSPLCLWCKQVYTFSPARFQKVVGAWIDLQTAAKFNQTFVSAGLYDQLRRPLSHCKWCRITLR